MKWFFTQWTSLASLSKGRFAEHSSSPTCFLELVKSYRARLVPARITPGNCNHHRWQLGAINTTESCLGRRLPDLRCNLCYFSSHSDCNLSVRACERCWSMLVSPLLAAAEFSSCLSRCKLSRSVLADNPLHYLQHALHFSSFLHNRHIPTCEQNFSGAGSCSFLKFGYFTFLLRNDTSFTCIKWCCFPSFSILINENAKHKRVANLLCSKPIVSPFRRTKKYLKTWEAQTGDIYVSLMPLKEMYYASLIFFFFFCVL